MTAGVGVLASAAALWFERTDFDPLDLVMLPGIAALWLALIFGVYRGWVRLNVAQIVLFAVYAVYFLLALNQQFRVFAPVHHMLSQNTYWFAPLYAAAFLYFRPQRAFRFSLSIFGLSMLITASHLAGNPALRQDATLLASTLQFVMVSLTMIFMQFVMGRRHLLMMAKQLAAYQDALTGTANRRAGEEHLLTLQQRGQDFTVALFDLDHFKNINDRHGHAAGDAVLRSVVQEAQRVMPDGTMCARWGGEEFLLILPALPGPDILRVLEHFRERLPSLKVGEVSGVTASFGVAQRLPGESSDELLRRADVALYEAKALGRNCIQHSAHQLTAAQP
ncbi:sensor domain-containing diguanylate cyclase [Deinococcus cavernae]|nr:GGDEF domain-containing protein [Deinococcus cavernae]